MIAVSSPTSHAEMVAAYKARQARFAAAARKVARRPKPAPATVLTRKKLVEWRKPRWKKQDIHFDAHVWALVMWKMNRGAKIRNYIRQRCIDMCICYTEVTRGGQGRALVPYRDKIIYEIKTKVDPDITWSSLGYHFNRDHSAVITAFYRGAAAAGDKDMAQKVADKRQRAKELHFVRKARGE